MTSHTNGNLTVEMGDPETGCPNCRAGVSPLDGAMIHASSCPIWKAVADANLTRW